MKNEDHKNGGRRPGSGRKFGTGPYGENTSVIRVPESQKAVITDFLEAYAKKQRLTQLKGNLDGVGDFHHPAIAPQALSLPLYQSKVPAGSPSPADNDVEEQIDMYEYLIGDANGAFFVTIQGESMIEVGLMPGDKAIVQKRNEASAGDIVLAVIDGEFTVKTLAKQPNGLPKLMPANSSGKYQPILITYKMQFEIAGVVTGAFRKF
jgi:DNA polymerase V